MRFVYRLSTLRADISGNRLRPIRFPETAMKKAFAALAILSMLALTGCNTIQGVGRDITATGEFLEDLVS